MNKAPGVDGIFPRILVENAVELSEPYTYIQSQSQVVLCRETGKRPMLLPFLKRVIRQCHVTIDQLV